MAAAVFTCLSCWMSNLTLSPCSQHTLNAVSKLRAKCCSCFLIFYQSCLIHWAAQMLPLLRKKMLIRMLRMFLLMMCLHAITLLVTTTCPITKLYTEWCKNVVLKLCRRLSEIGKWISMIVRPQMDRKIKFPLFSIYTSVKFWHDAFCCANKVTDWSLSKHNNWETKLLR